MGLARIGRTGRTAQISLEEMSRRAGRIGRSREMIGKETTSGGVVSSVGAETMRVGSGREQKAQSAE